MMAAVRNALWRSRKTGAGFGLRKGNGYGIRLKDTPTHARCDSPVGSAVSGFNQVSSNGGPSRKKADAREKSGRGGEAVSAHVSPVFIEPAALRWPGAVGGRGLLRLPSCLFSFIFSRTLRDERQKPARVVDHDVVQRVIGGARRLQLREENGDRLGVAAGCVG